MRYVVHPGADSVRLEQTPKTPRGRIPLQAGQVQKGGRKKMIIVPIWRWTWTQSLFLLTTLNSIQGFRHFFYSNKSQFMDFVTLY